jgi:hypothetical protein
MAIGTVSPSNHMNQMLAGYARNLGFSEVRIENRPGSYHSVLRVTYPDGTSAAAHFIEGAPPEQIIEMLKKMARSKANVLDIRMNAVESEDDFRALLYRAREQNRHIDTVIVTPDQKAALAQSAATLMNINGGLDKLYGCDLLVERQPNASY